MQLRRKKTDDIMASVSYLPSVTLVQITLVAYMAVDVLV